MRTRGKSIVLLVGAAVAALVITSCGYARTEPADQITETSFRLHGEVVNTEAAVTSYYFQYGFAPGVINMTLPTRTVDITEPDTGYPVTETVTDLTPGRTYQYRLCAYAGTDEVRCGQPQYVSTLPPEDTVRGTGFVLGDASSATAIGGEVSVRQTRDPEYGQGEVYAQLGGERNWWQATCLTVEGNRAAVGVTLNLTSGTQWWVVSIEDNGPTGDRWGQVQVGSEPTTCPTPTAADFPPFVVGSTAIPSTLTTGDFTVRDYPTS